MAGPLLKETPEGVHLAVRVKPKAGRDALLSPRDGMLQVCVRAAPADGEANDAVVALLAKSLGCGRTQVELVRGHKSREKTLLLRATSLEDVRAKLNLPESDAGT